MYDMANHLRLSLKVHVLVPEYPGYGIYRQTTLRKEIIKCSAEQILSDALLIFNYFTSADHIGGVGNGLSDNGGGNVDGNAGGHPVGASPKANNENTN